MDLSRILASNNEGELSWDWTGVQERPQQQRKQQRHCVEAVSGGTSGSDGAPIKSEQSTQTPILARPKSSHVVHVSDNHPHRPDDSHPSHQPASSSNGPHQRGDAASIPSRPSTRSPTQFNEGCWDPPPPLPGPRISSPGPPRAPRPSPALGPRAPPPTPTPVPPGPRTTSSVARPSTPTTARMTRSELHTTTLFRSLAKTLETIRREAGLGKWGGAAVISSNRERRRPRTVPR